MRKIAVRPVEWTPPRVRLILLILTLIVVLNAFDACATLLIVHVINADVELNPLMRWALKAGPVCFIAVKMGTVIGFASILAWLARRRRAAWIGLCIIAALYTALVLYQLSLFIIVQPPCLR